MLIFENKCIKVVELRAKGYLLSSPPSNPSAICPNVTQGKNAVITAASNKTKYTYIVRYKLSCILQILTVKQKM
jgi:hypothetical protein